MAVSTSRPSLVSDAPHFPPQELPALRALARRFPTVDAAGRWLRFTWAPGYSESVPAVAEFARIPPQSLRNSGEFRYRYASTQQPSTPDTHASHA